MSLFGSKSTFHLGVDIGAHGIKLVELKKTKGRPQLWTYGFMTEPLDIHVGEGTASPAETEKRIAEYAERLKALVKEAKVTSRIATASLPVSQVFHTAITLPPVDKKELDHHVRAKITKMLPLPLEEMQVVHQVIPEQQSVSKKGEYMRVLVTAASKKLVAFYTKIFQQAGLSLDELETEAFALQRSLVGTDQGTSMIIDMGAERSNFFIVDRTVPITHRSIQLGGNAFDAVLTQILGIDPSLSSQVKHDLSRVSAGRIDAEPFRSLIEPIMKEIEYHRELFTRQTGNEQKRMEKIIFTGGVVLFPPIIEMIGKAFALNVFIGDPWARVVYQQGLKRVLDAIGPRMAVSVGLALRNIV